MGKYNKFISLTRTTCVFYVCVFERERERERDTKRLSLIRTTQKWEKKN